MTRFQDLLAARRARATTPASILSFLAVRFPGLTFGLREDLEPDPFYDPPRSLWARLVQVWRGPVLTPRWPAVDVAVLASPPPPAEVLAQVREALRLAAPAGVVFRVSSFLMVEA